jgi:MFS family permease
LLRKSLFPGDILSCLPWRDRYILFEIPSNLILPKAGPANWLAFLGVSFGSILIGMAFAPNWGIMALCRALLGILEAGFLPGTLFLGSNVPPIDVD